MGQRIEIAEAQHVDSSMILTTNRSLTGTAGEGFDSTDQAAAAGTFAGKLAVDLFEADDRVERVYISSNVVVILRDGGWETEATDAAEEIVEDFFLYYPAA